MTRRRGLDRPQSHLAMGQTRREKRVEGSVKCYGYDGKLEVERGKY